MAPTDTQTYEQLKKRSGKGPKVHKRPAKKRGVSRSGPPMADMDDMQGMGAMGGAPPEMPLVDADGGMELEMPHSDAMAPQDGTGGAKIIPLFDGGMMIDFKPERSQAAKLEHDANLAEFIDESELSCVAETLLEGIQADDDSRQEWLQMRAKGIDLLGFKIEDPRSGTASAPVEGMSVVRHPLLAEAVLRGKANARGELLPASGPVKVRNDGEETNESDALARTLERDMNHFLTTTATEYYDDTDRMLFWTFFGGSGFKKVYTCPMRRRPVSESVDAKDLIISNNATDIRNASRITHCINMRPSVMKRMQLLDVYRDVDLDEPQQPMTNIVSEKINAVQGLSAPYRAEDRDYDLYEVYCELDLEGFEHKYTKGKKKGKPSGLPLPYRVTIEKMSRKILEIRRNWDEDDTDFNAKTVFVHFMFETGLGLYGLGLLHILGNTTNALTAAWREVLDAGMFANFPGFLYAKSSGTRNPSNQFRVAPGSGVAIETGGQPIQNAVMALPYKSADAGFVGFLDNVASTGSRLGGTSEAMVGEGKQEAPVGSTLALIEQASKIMSAVHKRLHSAQSEEFRLLADEFRKDPSALWKNNKRASRFWNLEKATAALENYALVPCADPNVPSQMHRLMKAQTIKTVAMASPQIYDMRKVDARVFREMGVSDPETMYAPPAPPPGPDPQAELAKAALQLKEKDQALKAMKVATDASIKREELVSKENIAALTLMQRIATNPESMDEVQHEMQEVAPFLNPTAHTPPPNAVPQLPPQFMPQQQMQPPQPQMPRPPMGP